MYLARKATWLEVGMHFEVFWMGPNGGGRLEFEAAVDAGVSYSSLSRDGYAWVGVTCDGKEIDEAELNRLIVNESKQKPKSSD